MADDKPNKADDNTPNASSRVSRLIHWTKASRLRMAVVGSLAVVGFGSTFAAWSYLAHLAVSEENPATLARAMEAMDKENYEEARSIVTRMQGNSNEIDGLGSSLFVLGAVKAAEAELEWSAGRRRAMHLVAARYLQKARSLGVPPVREVQLNYLLGQSLIRANQAQEGIEVLEDLLNDPGMPATEVHALLSKAYLGVPEPDLVSALEHNRAVLSDQDLDGELRTEALLTQVDILRRLGKIEDAREALAMASNEQSPPALAKSISGQLEISLAEQLPADSEERAKRFAKARDDLREAIHQDPLNGELTRQAMYWIGRSYELEGKIPDASNQYDRISKLYGDTPESIIATLTKADLDREAGDYKLSLVGYRSVLESVGEPLTYVNRLLPLSELRKRLVRAHAYFVQEEQFEHAMALVDQFPPVFGQMEVTELRARTHAKWGNLELERAAQSSHLYGEEAWKLGRYHLRAAGRDFETLSRLRFATREFTEDLWDAAESYYRGQSYTHAASVLREYLHHESRRHKATALLRLGQSLAAINEPKQAIAAFEECIEMHPNAGDIFQARLDCVRVYRQLGNSEKAEELLRSNLQGEDLLPTSPEWRDSLFALGELLHDLGRFEEAIKSLDEAVLRYPDDPKATLARYIIARSYHNAAEEPAEKIKAAKTENERQKNRKLRDQNLEAALQNYLIVQRMMSLDSGHAENGEMQRTLLRNCYMMQGSVLFELKRYEEARKAYSNVSTLYQNEPFVLESFVHIANCWSRLNQPVKARGTIEQAKLMLGTLPPDTDFKLATNFNRQQWGLLLEEMSKW